jgi:myosin I
MICSQTWPNFHGGSVREGVQLLLAERDLTAGSEIEYGRTKLFIRHPQTLLELENERARTIPTLCILLQRVK